MLNGWALGNSDLVIEQVIAVNHLLSGFGCVNGLCTRMP